MRVHFNYKAIMLCSANIHACHKYYNAYTTIKKGLHAVEVPENMKELFSHLKRIK